MTQWSDQECELAWPLMARRDPRLHEFLPLLEQIDALREALHERAADLFDKVNNSPVELRSDYHRFLQLGGSTAADLRIFLRGQQLRRIGDGASKDYGRLRLIAKTTPRDEWG
jgi:hypothetical protein